LLLNQCSYLIVLWSGFSTVCCEDVQFVHPVDNEISCVTSSLNVIEGLIQNLEEEAKTNKYMVGEVHPKEIAAVKKVIQNVQRIVTEPAMGQSDLDVIQQEVLVHVVFNCMNVRVHHMSLTTTWQVNWAG